MFIVANNEYRCKINGFGLFRVLPLRSLGPQTETGSSKAYRKISTHLFAHLP